MLKTAQSFPDPDAFIPVSDLARLSEDWLLDGDLRQLSKSTLANRRLYLNKLLWFLRQNAFSSCGTSDLRRFFAYIGNAHENSDGRWGNAQLKGKKARPSTVRAYFNHIRTFFQFLISEKVLSSSPMENLKPPLVRPDQIQPFTDDQVKALLATAKRSLHPKRDTAIVLFLLDTGCRASELCALKFKDLDMQGRRCAVMGKGNKTRPVYFGRDTAKVLWTYLKEECPSPDDPLFFADRGTRAGHPLTRSGLRQLIERLGAAAKLEACRCSPHTFRHTFAISFLRGGGNVFSLQQLLGHTSLHMTNRYVALAQGDIENQHRQYSPVDRLNKQ